MTIIDKLIKILINFKYKKEPFMACSWGIDDMHEINILTAEYYQDYYRYGTREEARVKNDKYKAEMESEE